MVPRLDSKGAKACKSCRSRQERSNDYLLFTCKNRRRYSREGPLKVCQQLAKRWIVSRGYRVYGNWLLRSEVNIELNFPPKLRGARSRLYRRRFLQVNTRWKALAEIYTMHSFAPFSNLNFFVKNRQNFFAIELMNIH